MENPQPTLLEQGWRYSSHLEETLIKQQCSVTGVAQDAILLGPALLHDYGFLIDAKGYVSVEPNKGTSVPGIYGVYHPKISNAWINGKDLTCGLQLQERDKTRSIYAAI